MAALAVPETAVAPCVALPERRRAHAGDERRGEARPGAVGRGPPVEVEALIVELGAGSPPHTASPVSEYTGEEGARGALERNPMRLVDRCERLLQGPVDPSVPGDLELDPGVVAVDEQDGVRAGCGVP